MSTETKRRKLIPEMNGFVARWYAKIRGTDTQLAAYRELAPKVTAGLPAGAAILEVAPGPGYFAVELAKLGYRVTGLDISSTAVEIAAGYAQRSGVRAEFRQ